MNYFLTNFISIATSTLVVDPYLVTNNFDNSLISKDVSFKGMTIPAPVLKWRESVNHPSHSAHQLPELKIDPTIQLHVNDDDDDDDDKNQLLQVQVVRTN